MMDSAGRGKFASHAIGDDNAIDRLGFGDDRGAGGGMGVTFDTLDVTTYLHSDNRADGSFSEHFILDIKGFELNGSPVNLPGFGTHYGMYFLLDATGQAVNGKPVFNTMNIALMVDRGNNDGAPSSTDLGGAVFANGTGGDTTLATGTLVQAGIDVDPVTGAFHPHFVQKLTPTEAGVKVFGASVSLGETLQEVLTTPGGPHVTSTGGGNSIQTVNGWGFGTASLDAPATIHPGQLIHG